jgi:hypothetical protein
MIPPTPAPARAPITEPVWAFGPVAQETNDTEEMRIRMFFFMLMDFVFLQTPV